MAIWKNQDDTQQSAKRLLKGSAAFTSALLFGNAETGSKGVLRTLGGASLLAAAAATKSLASMAAKPSDTSSTEEDVKQDLGWGDFGDGYGYYGKDGNRMD